MAGDGQLTALAAWLVERTAGAPAALRQRVREHVAAVEPTDSAPADLARAAHLSLAGVVDAPGDRSVALDLLAADGLITLALLRQAEERPMALAEFARSLTDVAASE
ncbi:MAG TPA: hypothetical protein VK012_00570 [Gemmatimonadales bacterium]|nr:hypothetical protein [Gemmatimonadales bacterium]